MLALAAALQVALDWHVPLRAGGPCVTCLSERHACQQRKLMEDALRGSWRTAAELLSGLQR